MPYPDEREDPEPETVSFGTGSGRGRLSRWISRLSLHQQSILLVGSTALLAVVVLITVVDSDRSPSERSAERSAPPTSGPDAAAVGTQPTEQAHGPYVWVGYRGLMVSMPRAWAASDPRSCDITSTLPPRQWVRARCATRGAPAASVVWLTRMPAADPSSNTSAGPGRGVVAGPIRSTGTSWTQAVSRRPGNVVVEIASASRPELSRLVASARSIPPDWVVVPALSGTDPKAAIRRLRALGLVPRVNHNSGLTLPPETAVVDQNPTEGQVVTPGSRVAFSVLPER